MKQEPAIPSEPLRQLLCTGCWRRAIRCQCASTNLNSKGTGVDRVTARPPWTRPYVFTGDQIAAATEAVLADGHQVEVGRKVRARLEAEAERFEAKDGTRSAVPRSRGRSDLAAIGANRGAALA